MKQRRLLVAIVTVKILEGKKEYFGSTKNGITTIDYHAHDESFEFK